LDTAIPARGSSTAERADISEAEIRRQQAADDAARQSEIERLRAEGKKAEQVGNLAIARVRYRQAAARTTGDMRQQLLQAAERLSNRK
jgi:hypothetical protein